MKFSTLLGRWCAGALVVMSTAAWAQPNPPGPTPVTNPIAVHYNSINRSFPAWTENLRWDNVINMAGYPHGANDFERFEHARDSAYNMGGGVLYYPAGVYNFQDHPTGPTGRGLMLRKGVMIMGEPPATDVQAIVDTATPGLTQLGTKFMFPYRTRTIGGNGEYPDTWNVIGLMPETGGRISDVTHVGIAWVHLDGAVVYMGPDMPWGATYATAGAWRSERVKNTGENWASRVPDGTHYADPFCGAPAELPYIKSLGHRFVFGCRLENAAAANDFISDAGGPNSTDVARPYDPDYLFNFRFAARVAVYGSHVFIANNAIPKSNKTFKFSQVTGTRGNPVIPRDILFDYGLQIGIEANKQLVSQRSNRCNVDEGPYYEQDVEIRDNFVYNHGNKGYEMCGKWMIIENNVNARDYLDNQGSRVGVSGTYTVTLDGFQISNQIDDNMSRAFDIGGWNLWIHKNWYNNTGSDPGNDGEGILIQRHGGVECFSWAYTYNGQGPDGENAYIAPYDVHVVGLFQGWNRQRGMVGPVGVRSNVVADAAVEGNINRQGVPVLANGVTGANVQDFLNGCVPGQSAAPVGLLVDTVYGGEAVKVEWTDIANNEIAFRVERRRVSSGIWETIAYRPRNESGGMFDYNGTDNGPALPGCVNGMRDFNEQVWLDFNAPLNEPLEYRVIAVNCTDDDTYATPASPPITVVSNKTYIAQAAAKNATLSLYPNPAQGEVSVVVKNLKGASNYQIFDAAGRLATSGKLVDAAGANIDLRGLNRGLYRIVVIGENGLLSKSLVVQ